MLRFQYVSDITREMFNDHRKLDNLTIKQFKFLAITSDVFMEIIFTKVFFSGPPAGPGTPKDPPLALIELLLFF